MAVVAPRAARKEQEHSGRDAHFSRSAPIVVVARRARMEL
jgi:hypothetical protein